MNLLEMMRLSLMKFNTILITKVVMGRAASPRSMSEPKVCPQSTIPQEQ